MNRKGIDYEHIDRILPDLFVYQRHRAIYRAIRVLLALTIERGKNSPHHKRNKGVNSSPFAACRIGKAIDRVGATERFTLRGGAYGSRQRKAGMYFR